MTPRVHVLRGAAGRPPGELLDWGPIDPPPGASGETSRTRGLLLFKGADGAPESGLWECTPGRWECRVTRDEFCHFLAGRCVYTDASGAATAIAAGDSAFFPAGWTGTCEVQETVRKVYMMR